MSMYTDVIARVPPGRIGIAEVIHDEPDQFTRLRAAIDGQPLAREKYARLTVCHQVMMTDAEFEHLTNRPLLLNAKGKCLVAGLGLGLIIEPLIRKCESVTVIEKEPDVVSLVGKYYPEIELITADIFEWKPPIGSCFDTIYFDIWPNICADDCKQAAGLHRKWRKYLSPDGWMESWCKIAYQTRHKR